MAMLDVQVESGDFSRRILTLLRERLRAYHLYELLPDASKQSWASVSQKIAALTGEVIPEESLRQIVNPQNKKRGKAPRRTANERWAAIRDFLVHPDVGYIHEVELTKASVSLHPLLSLQEFFKTGVTDQVPADQLQPTGIYSSEIEAATTAEEIELIIDFDQKTGLSEVLQINVLNDIQDTEEFWSKRVFEGFALYSETGIYLIALRDPLTKEGQVKIVLEADVAQRLEKRDDEEVISDLHINSFVAMENGFWRRVNIEEGLNPDVEEPDYGVPLDRYSGDVLKYFRTNVSKLTLDGEE